MLVRRGPALCCFDVRLVPLHFKVAHWVQNVMPCSDSLLGRSWLPGRRDYVVYFLKFVALLDGEFLALGRAHLGHELVEHLLLVRLSCLLLALRRRGATHCPRHLACTVSLAGGPPGGVALRGGSLGGCGGCGKLLRWSYLVASLTFLSIVLSFLASTFTSITFLGAPVCTA